MNSKMFIKLKNVLIFKKCVHIRKMPVNSENVCEFKKRGKGKGKIKINEERKERCVGSRTLGSRGSR